MSTSSAPPSRVPLTVIGGYLGAGKTTLLNHVLTRASGRRLGVIVNDFGEVGIDSTLLGDVHDGVINLPNGCVCCTVADGLGVALDQVGRADVDHVLIEASGVADPAVVAHWGTVPPFRPGGVVVLAAASSIGDSVDDRYVGDEVRRQLQGADLVVLTNTDRVDAAGARAASAVIASITDAPLITAVRGDVPTTEILGIDDPRPSLDSRGPEVGGLYTTSTWRSAAPISRTALDVLLDGMGRAVVRAKGIVLLDDGSAVEVQRVGRRTDIHPSPAVIDESVLVSIAVRSDEPV
ncbi:MAG: GTP-binding protein [Actinomycetota bacterium]